MKIYNVGIIGCGLIGAKRAKSLGERAKLIACCDIDLKKAKKIAKESNALIFKDWNDLIKLDEIDIVIVATLHNTLYPIAKETILAGKHLLIEKPGAKNSSELKELIEVSKKSNLKIRVGFNHRYHPAILKAKNIIENGALGDLMFIRGRYGHGGRIGYEKEWRANPSLSGGGELIDQGPHLIDLSSMFLGQFTKISGSAHTYFWKMPVEDNAFMILKNDENKTAFLHVSCTEWKNMFSMEIYGKRGKLEINGLGGSYGVEKLTHYNMLKEMGPPETSEWEYPEADNSWSIEINDFFNDIENNNEPEANLKTTLNCMEVIEKIYKDSKYDFSS